MESWRKELYLAHHGIKGQKWGVRRGPPYPLDASLRYVSERSEISGSFARGQQSKVDQMRKKYSEIGSSGTVKSKVTGDAVAISEKYGFSLVSSPQTVSADIKNANPGYYKHLDDSAWLNNCSHSCIAFVARRRGLNVEAAPMTKKQGEEGGITFQEACEWYFKGTFTDNDFDVADFRSVGGTISKVLIGIDFTRNGASYEKKASQKLSETYQNVPNGGYGIVKMQTKYGGHVFIWYKEDGAVKFADSQGGLNARVNFDNIAKFGVPNVLSVRLDNREMDPSRITEAIKPSKSELRHTALAFWGPIKMEAWRAELYHHGIKGMKWGIRRFQNKDGKLTALGRKRHKMDALGGRVGNFRNYLNDDGSLNQAGADAKKKFDDVNKFDESREKYRKAMDRDRQDAIDDFKRKSDNSTAIAREGLKIGTEGTKLFDRFTSRKQQPPVDLSSMTDQELQQKINRLNMEQNYRRLTASNETSKGRQFVDDVLSVGGSALAVTSSALAIALSIKQLRS